MGSTPQAAVPRQVVVPQPAEPLAQARQPEQARQALARLPSPPSPKPDKMQTPLAQNAAKKDPSLQTF